MKRLLMATAAVLVMATTAQAQTVDTVVTWSGVYTIKTDQIPWCVYRNNVEFHCSAGEYVNLGPPIRTKDYYLIPMIDSWSGSGRRMINLALIIEHGEKATIEKVVDQCFNASCDVRPITSNYRLNDVTFHVGRSEGYRISAHFHDSKLSVTKVRLSAKEPLDSDTCDELYEKLEYCRTYFHDPKGACRRTYANNTAAIFQMYRIETDYRGFTTESFDKLCRAACESGKKPSPAKFEKQFCARDRSKWLTTKGKFLYI